MAAVDLSKSAPAQLLDEVITLNRLNSAAGRAYAASVERITAVIEKPRTFYIPDSTMTSTTLGSPAFSLDGKIVGVVVMRAVNAKGGGSRNYRDNMTSIILPAEDILKAAKQAPEAKGGQEKKRKNRKRPRRRNRRRLLYRRYPRIARIDTKYFLPAPRCALSSCSNQLLIRVNLRNSRIIVQQREETLPAREPAVLAVEGQGHRGRLPHNAFPLNRPEIAGVETVVAIVPHHEVMPCRHTIGTEIPQRGR